VRTEVGVPDHIRGPFLARLEAWRHLACIASTYATSCASAARQSKPATARLYVSQSPGTRAPAARSPCSPRGMPDLNGQSPEFAPC
jgi:hypothetical protein